MAPASKFALSYMIQSQQYGHGLNPLSFAAADGEVQAREGVQKTDLPADNPSVKTPFRRTKF